MKKKSQKIRLMVAGAYGANADIAPVQQKLMSWGCRLLADETHLCTWSSAEVRAQYWLTQLENLDIDSYWLLRGGEGTADMIPYLHQYRERLAALPPRMIMGMSDATALLVYCAQHYGWPCVHVGNAIGFAMDQRFDAQSERRIRAFISGENRANTLEGLQPLNGAAESNLTLEGDVCIGNLSLLNISINDLWEFNADDKILMLEDWHEKGYVVERTLKYFQRIGKLDCIKALVFGDFLYEMSTELQRQYLQKVLMRFAQSLQVPVFQTDQFGHGTAQTPIIFNTPFAARSAIRYSRA